MSEIAPTIAVACRVFNPAHPQVADGEGAPDGLSGHAGMHGWSNTGPVCHCKWHWRYFHFGVHEFGHYLLHRLAYSDGIRCGEQDVVRWDSDYGQIEHQANRFAANLLMPLDDFRRQIGARAKVDLDLISYCAERYRVSLIAAILRWLTYTERRAVLVVSRDDFVLWSRSSDTALKTGAFFRTSGAPVEIPAASLAATRDQLVDGRAGVLHGPGVWFAEDVREMTIFSEQYDFTITLLLLEDRDRYVQLEPDPEEDTYDRFMSR